MAFVLVQSWGDPVDSSVSLVMCELTLAHDQEEGFFLRKIVLLTVA